MKISEIYQRTVSATRYLMITISVFVAHWFTGVTGAEARAVDPGRPIDWVLLFLIYLAFVVIFDGVAHRMLKL